MIRGDIDWRALAATYRDAAPFPHVVIDGFFEPEVAAALEQEVPPFDDPMWMQYSNPIEEKRALNHWDRFPPVTYRAFTLLNGLVPRLRELTGLDELFSDIGLHGGGWHVHGREGKLNVHLDYSIHPKLGLERRLNLIIYLTPGWDPAWGGALGLWSHDAEAHGPKELVRSVDCLFNRAVIFDTTANSWHGLPDPIACPAGVYRKSIAVYYLTPARGEAAERGKALFAPHGEQKDDERVLDLIRRRADVKTAPKTYRSE